MAPTLLSNPRVRAPLDAIPPPSREPLAFHRRLPAYARTPLTEAPALADRLGVGRLWVKDESARLGLPSFKVLGASWATYRAIAARLGAGLEPWSTLDELATRVAGLSRAAGAWPMALAAATDGNHGRAVARVAALLGLEARIFVPAGTAPARIGAIEAEGASCTVVDGTYDDAVRRSAEEAGSHCLVISDTSWPGYEDVPAWVIDGYSTVFWEVDEALGGAGLTGPDLVVTPIGVGALAAATVRHYFRPDRGRRTAIIGVEPLAAACVLASARAGRLVTVPGPHASIMAGLNCGTPSVVAWPSVSSGVDLFVAIDDEPAREAMRSLAAAGIVAGETGASALAGLGEVLTGPDHEERRRELGLGPGSSVLVICTEGATDPVAYRAIVGREPHLVGAAG
ncbi:MAG: diaminopropionate ammonia-lyase [Acidimicrobiales bacterium]